MKSMDIIKEPNPVLRKKAEAVAIADISSRKIQSLIRHMKETLAVTPDGVGIAAPQVGESLQIFIVSEEGEEIDRIEKLAVERNAYADSDAVSEESGKTEVKKGWNYYVFVNPVVKKISKRKNERAEGCLSVPGKFGGVSRYEKITVEAYDECGKKFVRGASRFVARIIQHELDHLQGTLFIDKAEKIFEPDAR